MTRKEFIEKAREVHGNEYDYKSVPDINLENYSTIPITCERHGTFYDTVYNHLQGKECFKCFIDKIKMA